jgi:hypothetical protein
MRQSNATRHVRANLKTAILVRTFFILNQLINETRVRNAQGLQGFKVYEVLSLVHEGFRGFGVDLVPGFLSVRNTFCVNLASESALGLGFSG